MRKSIFSPRAAEMRDGQWIDLSSCSVEISSEDPLHPIEHALTELKSDGWRAAAPGKQTIRVQFERPQRVCRIQLAFEETALDRNQEFSISWAPEAGGPLREIRRQQWNFSPGGSTEEIEDYAVDLEGVRVLQLDIDPDRDRNEALASLRSLRVG